MAQNSGVKTRGHREQFPPKATSIPGKRSCKIGSQVLFSAGVYLLSQFFRAQIGLAKSTEEQLTTRHYSGECTDVTNTYASFPN